MSKDKPKPTNSDPKDSKPQTNESSNQKPDSKPAGTLEYTPFDGIDGDDVTEFIQLKHDTGTPVNIDDLERDELEELTSECRAWLKAGKPAATMPKIDASNDIMMSVYRVRHHGKQYLYYFTEDSDPPIGVERSNVYRKYKEDGLYKVDKAVIVSTKDFYTIDHTDAKCKEFAARCGKESTNPKYYIKEGNRTFEIKNPDNFSKDFDAMFERATSRKLI